MQLNNSLVQAQKTNRVKKKCSYVIKSLRWTFNKTKLLCYEEQLYIFSEASIRTKLLRCHHDDVLARHFDIEQTLKLMLHKYYWSELTKNIKKYVFSCNIYQWVKTFRHHSYSKMQSLSQSSDFWQEMIMNIIISLLSSKCRNNMYDVILVIVDHYIKMTQYISVNKTFNAMKLADIFFKQIMCCFETSKKIVSDKDSIFINSF